MLVGALLGARFGVRAIPDEWLRATASAETTARHALEIATWGWNPPGL
jgi:ADP-ribosylglycohydrolase